jgi:hypothetical protein
MSLSCLFDVSTDLFKYVSLEPVVLLTILDQYLRRTEGQNFVIGTVLGNIEDGAVVLSDCFVVPHIMMMQNNDLNLNVESYRTMIRLHAEVKPAERIVGWCSIGEVPQNLRVLINDFFAREMNNDIPIHVVVEDNFSDLSSSTNASDAMKSPLSIKCFYGVQVQIGGKRLQNQFRPLRHNFKSYQPERMTLQLLQKAIPEVLGNEGKPVSSRTLKSDVNDLEQLERLFERVLSMVEELSTYVNEVVENKREGSVELARLLEDCMSLVPPSLTMPSEDKESLGDNVASIISKDRSQALLMVYLAQLTHARLLLTEVSTTGGSSRGTSGAQ